MNKKFVEMVCKNVETVMNENNINKDKILLKARKLVASIINGTTTGIAKTNLSVVAELIGTTEEKLIFSSKNNIVFGMLDTDFGFELNLKERYEILNRYYNIPKDAALKMEKGNRYNDAGYIEDMEYIEKTIKLKEYLGKDFQPFFKGRVPNIVKPAEEIEDIIKTDALSKETFKGRFTALVAASPLSREEMAKKFNVDVEQFNLDIKAMVKSGHYVREYIKINCLDVLGANYASLLKLTSDYTKDISIDETEDMFIEDARIKGINIMKVRKDLRSFFECKSSSNFEKEVIRRELSEKELIKLSTAKKISNAVTLTGVFENTNERFSKKVDDIAEKLYGVDKQYNKTELKRYYSSSQFELITYEELTNIDNPVIDIVDSVEVLPEEIEDFIVAGASEL